MAGRYSGGIPQRAGGANRFGFRPSGGDSSKSPCQDGPCSRTQSPSSAISGAALPQTQALLQRSARQTCAAPKPQASKIATPPQRGGIPRPRGIPCPQAGTSRIASPKSTCPCPPRAATSSAQRSFSPQATTVPCPSRPASSPVTRDLRPPASPPQVRKSGLRPPGSGLRPPGTGIRPPGSGIRPPGSGLMPPSGGLRSPGSGIRPPGSGNRPPGSGIRPAGSGIRPPGSGMRPPGSGMRPPGSGMRPPGSGMRPSSSGLRAPSMRCERPSMRAPSPPSKAMVPCPARASEEEEEEEDDDEEDIAEKVRENLERKEVEERNSVLANLEDMQSFRREFILNSIPQRTNPFGEGEYKGYTGECVTQEMLEGRYYLFKRSKEEFFSGASESDDDLDKIEPDYLIEEEEEEEVGTDLEEFLSAGGNRPACRTVENRTETYSEELFRVMGDEDD